MIETDKWMSIGEIVAPQGLRGDLRIKPSSDFPERFTKPGKRWIQKTDELPTEIKLTKGTKTFLPSTNSISRRSFPPLIKSVT